MDAQALGRLLREAREAREISLAEAEQALRIRQRVLVAFEDGIFEQPEASLVQLRGFLGNYARYLELDEDRVLEQFELQRHSAQRRQQRERRRRRPGKPTVEQEPVPQLDLSGGERLQQRRRRQRGFLSGLLLFLTGAVAIGVIVFVALQFLEDSEAPFVLEGELPQLIPPTVLPTVVMQLNVTEPPGRTLAQRQRQVTQLWNGSGVLVTTEAAQRTWLRVTADGEEEFVGMLRPGEHIEVAARTEILLTASNAEALLITWNGQEQGVPGLRGQLVEMTFTQTSVALDAGAGFEPTPVFTPTAQPTSLIDVGALLLTLTPETTAGPLQGAALQSPPSSTPAPTSTPVPTLTATLGPSSTAILTPTSTTTATATATASVTVTTFLPVTATGVLPPRETQTPAKALRNG